MKQLLLLIISILMLVGCSEQRVKLLTPPAPPPPPVEKRPDDYTDIRNTAYRSRRQVPIMQTRYEGSLWEDEASWGNLFRDHRARFRGDLVKIINIQEMISIPEKKEKKKPPAAGPAAAGEKVAKQINQALDIATGMAKAEEEEYEVLSSLRSISAYVERVLPNGNMVIIGEKVDYRQQNSIRYVTTVQGIIRPSDVNDGNEVPAIKLARFEPKIKRQMLSKNLNSLAPIIGSQKAGLLDRLSHIATPQRQTAAPVNQK
ncbi:MAG: flagellar basal body L-ring protein FlgH [SAR324 cluster bacterium]|nr:flagellar basal body L-ring protein FlgH [SAR324 cluster bacterium]